MTEDELGCERDHDRLIVLEARVDEYRRSMEERLEKLNELRAQVSQDRQAYLRMDVYEPRHEDLRNRMDSLQGIMQTRIENMSKELEQRMEGNYKTLIGMIDPLEKGQNRLIGIGVAFIGIAGTLGVLMGHFWK